MTAIRVETNADIRPCPGLPARMHDFDQVGPGAVIGSEPADAGLSEVRSQRVQILAVTHAARAVPASGVPSRTSVIVTSISIATPVHRIGSRCVRGVSPSEERCLLLDGVGIAP